MHQKYQEVESRLIDYIDLSPIQRYMKYKEFPWSSIMTLCLVFVTTLMVSTTSLGKSVQERNIQLFFNFHLLEHQSVDIYEAKDVFTWNHQEYKDYLAMFSFFNRTLDIVTNLNQYNFHNSNQTHTNTITHSVTKYYQEDNAQKLELTLQQILQSQILTNNLKSTLSDVKRIIVVFHLNNMTTNVRDMDLILDIDVVMKFQIKVTVDTKFYNQTYKQENRKPHKGKEDNLQVRKVPPHHHNTFSPYNLEYFFRIVLVLMSFHEGIRRMLMYKRHPFRIEGISEGEPWQRLPLLNQCKLVGWWNIVAILLNIVGIVNYGVAVFTAWVQLIQYIEYTKNPYVITFLLKRILKILVIVIFTTFFVITGFVVFSMTVFSGLAKFQEPEKSYFTYAYNNFQYGIYENFIFIGQYGKFYQLMYFIFCFYMVWCTNNIVPSIICNTVINKNRLNYLTKFFKEIRIPCPVCQHITNEEAKRAANESYGITGFNREPQQSQIDVKLESPKVMPYFSPKLLPGFKTKIRQANEPTRRRTKFEIVEELNNQLEISSMELYTKKVELFRKKIDQSLLQLDILCERGYNKMIKQKLISSNDKLNAFKMKIDKKIQAEKGEIKKAVSLKKIQNEKKIGSFNPKSQRKID